MRLGNVFRKKCFIDSRRLADVGLKSTVCRYCASSGLDVCDIMLFVKAYDCCVYRGTYHITVFLFLVPLIISCVLFWTEISCLSSVMVHPSSHRTPNYIIGSIFIFGKMWVYLASLIIPGSWSDTICQDSIVLPSGSLAVI